MIMRAAGQLTWCITALCAAATMPVEGDWDASVGSGQPPHYFGDVGHAVMPASILHTCMCGCAMPCLILVADTRHRHSARTSCIQPTLDDASSNTRRARFTGLIKTTLVPAATAQPSPTRWVQAYTLVACTLAKGCGVCHSRVV